MTAVGPVQRRLPFAGGPLSARYRFTLTGAVRAGTREDGNLQFADRSCIGNGASQSLEAKESAGRARPTPYIVWRGDFNQKRFFGQSTDW